MVQKTRIRVVTVYNVMAPDDVNLEDLTPEEAKAYAIDVVEIYHEVQPARDAT